jgi:hypothetical protein
MLMTIYNFKCYIFKNIRVVHTKSSIYQIFENDFFLILGKEPVAILEFFI